MRVLLIAVLGLALSACNLIYKLPTRQGNVIEQKQLDQLKVGMTRDQALFLLGTPIAASPFRADRWDYLGYYKSPRGQVSSRTVTLYFEADKLARIDGAAPVAGTSSLDTPDAKAVVEQQKKDKVEAERAAEPTESGVVLTPESAPQAP